MDKKTLEEYLTIKTGQDLIDKKVIPKTSSEHLALVVYNRLKALKQKIEERTDDEVLGKWKPAIDDTSYTLKDGVVADKKLGHIIRFKEELKGNSIPKGAKGQLIDFDAAKKKVLIMVDIEGNKQNFNFPTKDIVSVLEVSSLGQIEPMDKEGEVKRQTLTDFFPTTVLQPERTERIIIGLLMGKDFILYGPPGGGKSNVAKDILSIAKQQEYIFIVEGCKVQCNPFSIFDPKFVKEVPLCPECMIKYGGEEFKKTGRFTPPKPKNVKVTVATYTDGFGMEYTEGTVGLNRMHLAGFKLPKLDGTTTEGRESEFDPEGMQAGVLSRTNNGVLVMEEMDKLRPQTLDCLLEALNGNRVKPDQLRFTYPANAIVIGTANDVTVFSGALNDRMLLAAIRYPKDTDVSYAITRRSFYGEAIALEEVEITDTHKQEPIGLHGMVMPVIIERAIDSLYLELRGSYNGKGKNDVSGSNRSKLDALNASRAKLVFEKVFHSSTAPIVGEEEAIYGIQYAVCTRVQEKGEKASKESKDEINNWIKTKFPELLKKEADTWWCRAYKHMAIANNVIPGIEEQFVGELKKYEQDEDGRLIYKAFELIKVAYSQPTNAAAQKVKVNYPFMDYLFKEQPGFEGTKTKEEVVATVKYLLEQSKNSSCKI